MPILLDLKELLTEDISFAFLSFFQESDEERRSIDRAKFCNLQIPFFDTEIEQFSVQR